MKEIYEKYVTIFKVLIKNAGIETGNSVYKNVQKIFETECVTNAIGKAMEDNIEFRCFVALLIFQIVFYVHGGDKLEKMNEDEIKELVTGMYKIYLEESTINFCKKYGLVCFDDPQISFIVKSSNNKNEKLCS